MKIWIAVECRDLWRRCSGGVALFHEWRPLLVDDISEGHRGDRKTTLVINMIEVCNYHRNAKRKQHEVEVECSFIERLASITIDNDR